MGEWGGGGHVIKAIKYTAMDPEFELECQKCKDKELTQLLCNVSDLHVFFPDLIVSC